MAWWIPEILRVAVLLAGAVLVQQLIRRHGAFAEEVFRATPRAGAAFLALADIAYYLIVVAFTLFDVRLRGQSGHATLSQLQSIAASVGGLALIIGALHAFNVFVLPSVGRSLARQSESKPATTSAARS